MESDSMRKALQSRRGKGIDVSIILGQPDDGGMPMKPQSDESRKSDLAPAPDHPIDSDQGMMQPQMPQAPMGHAPLSEMKDSDLMDGMSDYDKSDAMADRDPRSLMDRARMDMMKSQSLKK